MYKIKKTDTKFPAILFLVRKRELKIETSDAQCFINRIDASYVVVGRT